jgi:manganese transport system permease protein
VAMLIIPGATAYLLTDRFGRMLIIAPAVSVTCAVTGLYLSYHLDTAPGGMVVVVQGLVFTAVYLFAPAQGVIGRRIAAARRSKRAASVSVRG